MSKRNRTSEGISQSAGRACVSKCTPADCNGMATMTDVRRRYIREEDLVVWQVKQ